jgi:hypothetical protein
MVTSDRDEIGGKINIICQLQLVSYLLTFIN